MEKRFVYADNAATTPVTPAVLEAMTPWLMENYGNPSSIYSIGRAARTAVEKARRQVAAALNAEPGEIYFTSCGTEADNWALKGSMRRWAAKGKKHLITAAFEHHAILHSAKALEKEGFEITYLPVTPEGLVDPAELEKAIREDTALVSIMLANNEIGTVQPIAELAAIAHAHGAWFHTDAVQAVGHIPVDVKALGVDMLSLSGHKFHAPKGVGALYVKKGILPNIFMDGGAQEKGRRAGTENLASIVGLGEAITVATASLEENMARITAMRDRLIDSLLQLPRTRLNGSREHRLPGNRESHPAFKARRQLNMILLARARGIVRFSFKHLSVAAGNYGFSAVYRAYGAARRENHAYAQGTFARIAHPNAQICIILALLEIFRQRRIKALAPAAPVIIQKHLIAFAGIGVLLSNLNFSKRYPKRG